MRPNAIWNLLAVAVAGSALLACDSGGIGDPCIPEDEFESSFSGFTLDQVNVESRSFQCQTRVCLVANFQGRVSCPYGQSEADVAGLAPTDPGRCRIPGTSGDDVRDAVSVEVLAQQTNRPPSDAVYCSCRCAGPDPNARYCSCPSGFECQELIEDLGLGKGQLAGSYCVREGTFPAPQPESVCSRAEPAGAPRSCVEGQYFQVSDGQTVRNP